MDTYRLQLGSLNCRVESGQHELADVLSRVYGTPLSPEVNGSTPELTIRMEERVDRPIRGTDQLSVTPLEEGFLLESDPLDIDLQFSSGIPSPVFS